MKAELAAGMVVVAVIAAGVWLADPYYFSPEKTVETIAEPCRNTADVIFGLEIAKWKIENHTDILNPYRRERDQMVEDCVVRQGSWCPVKTGIDWPCGDGWCFLPKGKIARWLYNLGHPGAEVLKCVGG